MNRRIIAITVSISLVVSSVISCSSDDHTSHKEVSYVEDGTWWDDNIVYPDLGGIDDLQGFNVIATDGDTLVAEEYLKSTTTPYMLVEYKMDGTLVGRIDPSEYGNVQDVFLSDGQYYAFVYGDDSGADTITNLIYKTDFAKGVFTEPEEVTVPPKTMTFSGVNNVSRNGDMLIYSFQQSGFDSSNRQAIVIDDGTGDIRTYEPDIVPDMEACYIMGMMFYKGDIVFEADVETGDDHKCYMCRLNIDDLTVSVNELPDSVMNGWFVEDDAVYFPRSDAEDELGGAVIVRYDPATGELSDMLRYSDTYINNEFDMSSNYRILYASEDKVSVYAEQSGIAWGNGDPVLITLTRADSNPNKGKKILELAYVDWPSFGLCEAVNSYNRDSDDRYVRLVNKYHSFDRDVTESVDILMEDIRSELGPDMVILNSDHAVLDDDRYLVDVSGLCGMDSPYYRVPYGICYRGLVVKTSLLDDPDQKGITYEQYDELVKSANNGLNVLGVEKKDIFNRLFMNSSGSFFDSRGRIDLDNDDFRALAEYVKNMTEPADISSLGFEPVTDLSWKGFPGFLKYSGKYNGDYSIIGYPSRDGSVPEIMDTVGIAITSCSGSREDCISFINAFLLPDVQSRICSYNENPVSQEGMRLRAIKIVEEFNRFDAKNSLADDGVWPADAIDHYLDELSDSRTERDVDSTVLEILDEEIQPYLEGQKSIDEVIDLAGNRINIMMNERK
ncbi:ABC-type glycerol-3-phosphate transport system, substrate-binding protein [Ruminococcaceae bacterium YRB3002]|nr:ABC-type glycerol-3-phosphate transport system, substrate-binding protein [Ruminococcaceae bacterium YRB3002]